MRLQLAVGWGLEQIESRSSVERTRAAAWAGGGTSSGQSGSDSDRSQPDSQYVYSDKRRTLIAWRQGMLAKINRVLEVRATKLPGCLGQLMIPNTRDLLVVRLCDRAHAAPLVFALSQPEYQRLGELSTARALPPEIVHYLRCSRRHFLQPTVCPVIAPKQQSLHCCCSHALAATRS